MISTQEAIDLLKRVRGGDIFTPGWDTLEAFDMAIDALERQDKADNEWCTGCKEYDAEKHCCPRYNKVIREAVDEVRQQAWIPTEDYLPEVGQRALVQFKDGGVSVLRCNDAGHLQCFYANTVAWMPAPVPYLQR